MEGNTCSILGLKTGSKYLVAGTSAYLAQCPHVGLYPKCLLDKWMPNEWIKELVFTITSRGDTSNGY